MSKISENMRTVSYFMVLFLAIVISLFPVPNIHATIDSPHTLGAHRGSSTLYTENTLESIGAALENPKYEFIEFDVQYTKDKKIIVYHDNTLFRLQQKIDRVNHLTYEELSEKSQFHIPLYQEVLDLINNRKKINIEIKSQGDLSADQELVDWVINDLRKRGILDHTLISAISPEIVEYVSTNYPELKVGQIFWITPSTYFGSNFLTQRLFNHVSQTGADYIMLHGINLRNYSTLLELKPDDKTLVFWHFDDTMYVVHNTPFDSMW
jgi:glycerophosphoryl diester phosphodiesterase